MPDGFADALFLAALVANESQSGIPLDEVRLRLERDVAASWGW